MNESDAGASSAERPGSGGRPWRDSGDAGSPSPDARLCGTGVGLAVALATVADDLDGAELSAVCERSRGRLVDVAVAAERVKAWASAVQAHGGPPRRQTLPAPASGTTRRRPTGSSR